MEGRSYKAWINKSRRLRKRTVSLRSLLWPLATSLGMVARVGRTQTQATWVNLFVNPCAASTCTWHWVLWQWVPPPLLSSRLHHCQMACAFSLLPSSPSSLLPLSHDPHSRVCANQCSSKVHDTITQVISQWKGTITAHVHISVIIFVFVPFHSNVTQWPTVYVNLSPLNSYNPNRA